jgi:hypothetical protein
MHKIAFDLISEALETICTGGVYRAGSVREDAVPPSAFAVVRFGVAQPGMSSVKQLNCTVWIHNPGADYTPVDDGLRAVYGRLDGAEHVRENGDPGSAELILAKWLESSGDLFDPGFRTVTKNASYNLTGTGV